MLEDDAAVLARAMAFHTVDKEPSLCRRAEPRENGERRALAAAGGADDADEFSRLHGQTQMRHRFIWRAAVLIAERHIVEHDFRRGIF